MAVSHILSQNSIRSRALLWAVPVAALAAALLNTLIFAFGFTLGAFPPSVIIPNVDAPMTVPPIVTASLLGVGAGGAVLALLERFTRKAVRVYQVVGSIFLVLSFITPFTIPDAPLSMVLALELMHLTTGAAALWLAPRLVR